MDDSDHEVFWVDCQMVQIRRCALSCWFFRVVTNLVVKIMMIQIMEYWLGWLSDGQDCPREPRYWWLKFSLKES